jgi:hypothetical protein
MTPETVAGYAKKDSRALSKVDSDDLIDELRVRLFENGSLPAGELCERVEETIAKYKQHVKEDE